MLFVTGLCPRRCFYCPVSEHKFGTDDVYADEWKLSKDPAQADQELLEECRLIEAKGAGITGGDPLATLAKTTHYIQLLKKQFGKSFHIHLYTSLNLLTQKTLEQLHDAGLDEIRFHPDLQDSKFWERLILTKQFCGDVGIEIPAIPGLEKETQALLDYLGVNCPHIRFINFNELEFSDTEAKHYTLGEKGYWILTRSSEDKANSTRYEIVDSYIKNMESNLKSGDSKPLQDSNKNIRPLK